MNLFILDFQPVQAAQFNCDSHIRSGMIETVAMMGFAYDDGDFEPWKWLSHKDRHYNHPMARWIRNSRQNFDWTIQHAYGLAYEFEYRFEKVHKCKTYLDWISLRLPMNNLPDTRQTDPPRCFGVFKELVGVTDNAVYDYRRYYQLAKRHLAKWSKREVPDWFRYDSYA